MGTTKLADVSHSAVQTWVSEVAASRSAATTRKVHRVLSLVLAMAVKDDRLVRNPAAGVSLPRVNAAERMYLSHQQVLPKGPCVAPQRNHATAPASSIKAGR